MKIFYTFYQNLFLTILHVYVILDLHIFFSTKSTYHSRNNILINSKFDVQINNLILF